MCCNPGLSLSPSRFRHWMRSFELEHSLYVLFSLRFVRSEDLDPDAWANDEDYRREKELFKEMREHLAMLQPWRPSARYFDEYHTKSRRGRVDRKHLQAFMHRIYERVPELADIKHPIQCYIPEGVQYVPKIRCFRLQPTIEGSVYYTAYRKKYVEQGGSSLTDIEAVREVDPRFAKQFPPPTVGGPISPQNMAEQVCASSISVFEPDMDIDHTTGSIEGRPFTRQSSSDSDTAAKSPLHNYDGPAN